jgi:hypothetical protein
MLVTDDGMLTVARDVQPWKAACPMLVTDDGMLTWPSLSGGNIQPASTDL